MRKILIVSILLLAMFSAATSSEKHKYNSVNEAIESAYHGGYLPSVASEYIAQAIGLDWEVKNSRPDMGVDIRGYVSNNCEYCILSYAGFGEWGQGGTVEYCALDSTGLVLWTKQSAIASRPAISNSGISVLMTRSDRNEGQKRFLDIVILDKNGKILLKHPVQELLNRPVQRSYFREYYGFTEDGLIFYSTLNLKPEEPVTIDSIQVDDYYNNASLFVYDAEADKQYQYYLGDFYCRGDITNIGSEKFSLHGTWNSNSKRRFEEGYYIVSRRGVALNKRITATNEMINKEYR